MTVVTLVQWTTDTYEWRHAMHVVIDLVGDGEEVAPKDDTEAQRLEEERRQKEAWYEWARIHEQVVPQVIEVAAAAKAAN